MTQDERVLKARLEWPLVRLLLIGATIITDTASSVSSYEQRQEEFFGSMSHDEKHKAVRVAVECALYWRLYEYRMCLLLM